ncbi:phytanoyl-CoA dioxygenase family protein [Gammaproteobacteria bacterium]|nr:phytanoyl-CoA dioxygenase family protein [Gammaproteobacteria bacterium]
MEQADIAREYNEKGFVVIKSLIDDSACSRFRNIARRYDSGNTTNENITYFTHPLRFFDPRVYRHYFQWLSFQFFKDSYFLSSQISQPKFQSITKELGLENFKKLTRIDSYISYQGNEDPTEWHTDQAFGGATHPAEFFGGTSGLMPTSNINRLFIHLTPVQYLNGCFSYIPYSHKINIAIRSLINSGTVKYKPIYLLKDAIDLVNSEYRSSISNLCSYEEIEQFIEHGMKALESDQDYVLECEEGDAVLFNDFGYHKGTAPQANDRIVFRYWY